MLRILGCSSFVSWTARTKHMMCSPRKICWSGAYSGLREGSQFSTDQGHLGPRSVERASTPTKTERRRSYERNSRKRGVSLLPAGLRGVRKRWKGCEVAVSRNRLGRSESRVDTCSESAWTPNHGTGEPKRCRLNVTGDDSYTFSSPYVGVGSYFGP